MKKIILISMLFACSEEEIEISKQDLDFKKIVIEPVVNKEEIDEQIVIFCILETEEIELSDTSETFHFQETLPKLPPSKPNPPHPKNKKPTVMDGLL